MMLLIVIYCKNCGLKDHERNKTGFFHPFDIFYIEKKIRVFNCTGNATYGLIRIKILPKQVEAVG